MKKILYLHGLDSKPNEEKIAILENGFGLAVIAPKLDYYASEGSTQLFDSLCERIRKLRIDGIVGSSFGGFMGFYLSSQFNIPAYLFNPALHSRAIDVKVEYPKNSPQKVIFLGKHDDVIDPERTKKFLVDHDYKNYFVVEEDFGHALPVEVFRELLRRYM